MTQKYPEGAIIQAAHGKVKVLGCVGEAIFLKVIEGATDIQSQFFFRDEEWMETRGWTVEETPWVPTVDEKYWYVDGMARVCSRFYFSPNQPDDKALTELGNCYRTQELAKAAAERVRKAYKGEK